MCYRLGWQGLVNLSFWQGKLSSLAKDFNMSQDTSGIATPASQSTVFEHNASSVLGRIKSLDFRRSIEKSVSRLDVVDSPHHREFCINYTINYKMCF